jgi:hypothetical protein
MNPNILCALLILSPLIIIGIAKVLGVIVGKIYQVCSYKKK